ncbi:MAG: transcriptional regulator [Bacteroidetes bacterium]|jgi:predicted transcriptional regulator of viral defense system|nr:transcriptional regulator [Bacteroidota bacterium]
MSEIEEHVLSLARTKGVLRGSDLEAEGIPRQYLYRLYDKGALERVARGLYMLAGADVTEHHTMVEVSRRVPHGVVCLLSALRFRELTTQNPFAVWLAIENHARRPKAEALPLRIVYMSGEAFTSGVEEHEIEGVAVPIYSAAKTVADCFKFRNKIGTGVAIEALRDYRRHASFDMDALWRYAEVCRVASVMRPYLEAIV